MQSIHPHMSGLLHGTAGVPRHTMQDDKRMDDGVRDRRGEYWSDQPTPEGQMMLAAWHKSAAKHMQRAAQATPPADDDYDMDMYSSAASPRGRFDMEYDMDAYTSSSSPAMFDSASFSGMNPGSAAGAFADLGLTGNETDEIYCQMLLQLNRENCHLKMQLRQAHRQVRNLAAEMEQLKREHLADERAKLAASGGPGAGIDRNANGNLKGELGGWLSGTQGRQQPPPPKLAAGWDLSGAAFPGAARAAEGLGGLLGLNSLNLKHSGTPDPELVQAAQAQPMSAASSSMPSPSGSMLSSAGTRADLDAERKASSVPPTGSSGGGGEKEKEKEKGKGGAKRPQHWTEEEHKRFLEAMKIFGYSSAQDIARYVGTRSVTQVRTHTQKHFLKLCKGAPGLQA